MPNLWIQHLKSKPRLIIHWKYLRMEDTCLTRREIPLTPVFHPTPDVWPAQDTQRRHFPMTNHLYCLAKKLAGILSPLAGRTEMFMKNSSELAQRVRKSDTWKGEMMVGGQPIHKSASWWRSAGILHTPDPGQNPGRTNHHPSTRYLCANGTLPAFHLLYVRRYIF